MVRLYPHAFRYGTVAFIVLFATWYGVVYRAPNDFVSGKLIVIEEGETLSHVAMRFEDEHVVRSSFWLQAMVTMLGGERSIQAGDYYFPSRTGLGNIVWRLRAGDFGLESLRVTIPEGSSILDIAEILGNSLTVFDKEAFITLAESREGYLFPDTYLFLPNITERRIAKIMNDTFLGRIQTLDEEIIAFGRPVDEVVTMASILEREAYTMESRRIIAGILWKRIEIGMPLQVDATFDYVNGKNTFELTLEDLKIESPYNTYRNIGLPPGPIANPGIDALMAAVTPIESDYLFFLSDKNGTVHYSATFEEHKQKKVLYLN